MSFIINPYSFGGVAWQPDDVSGLLHWADFSDITTLFTDDAQTTAVTSDTDPIGGVADKSTNNVDLAQSTAGDRPQYKTNIINSLSVSRGDGTSEYLVGSLAANSLSAFTVYGVFRTGASVAVSTKGVFDWADNSTASGTPLLLLQINSGNLRGYVNNGYNFSVAVTANTVYQVRLQWDGTDWKLRVNGTDETNYTGGAANKAGATHIHYNTGFIGYSDVDQGEWFIYDSALSGTNDTNAENYLQAKWAAY